MGQEMLEHYAKVANYRECISFMLMMGVPMDKIPQKMKVDNSAAFIHAYTDMLYLYGFLR